MEMIRKFFPFPLWKRFRKSGIPDQFRNDFLSVNRNPVSENSGLRKNLYIYNSYFLTLYYLKLPSTPTINLIGLIFHLSFFVKLDMNMEHVYQLHTLILHFFNGILPPLPPPEFLVLRIHYQNLKNQFSNLKSNINSQINLKVENNNFFISSFLRPPCL